MASAAVKGRLGYEREGERQRRKGVIDVAGEPPTPFGRHLFYLWAPNRGTQDECGRVGLGKEEGSRPGQAPGCGCPSGSLPPCRRCVGGFGSARRAVSGSGGCVTYVPAFSGPRRVCWSGTCSN